MYHENTGNLLKGLPRLSKPPCPWPVKRFPVTEERSKDGKYRF
nr:MAG TPA: hypothetical protein [Caudoviricetes sp.]